MIQKARERWIESSSSVVVKDEESGRLSTERARNPIEGMRAKALDEEEPDDEIVVGREGSVVGVAVGVRRVSDLD